ncbi:hypothetical protein EDD16DRAFT_1522434 [Pisolithus croceorrhizus]|nr:hypothetical protein EDD16DRAFT_1522434 [Pisolithus croceorrhizus]KAI6123138.1 hypothetical protein EV401DRAFT_1887002 [Pisolithus croceorrhizus]
MWRITNPRQATGWFFKKGTSTVCCPYYLSRPTATVKWQKIVMTSERVSNESTMPPQPLQGGSGLAYSVEKGANIITEAGQLGMDELIKTCPEAAQFRSKGFQVLGAYVKARGTNVHHTTGARNPSTFLVLPIISLHPAVVQLAMQIHPSQ